MSGIETWIYLVVIPNLGILLSGIWVISILFIAGVFAATCDEWREETINYSKKIIKRLFIVGSIAVCLSAVIPDKKEMAAIILVPYVTSNQEFKQLPTNLIKKLNDYLTEESINEGK